LALNLAQTLDQQRHLNWHLLGHRIIAL